jgi:hypothetical protein
LPAAPAVKPRGDQHWSTFPDNYAQAIIACDFCVLASVTFQLFYLFVVIPHTSLGLGLPVPRRIAVGWAFWFGAFDPAAPPLQTLAASKCTFLFRRSRHEV